MPKNSERMNREVYRQNMKTYAEAVRADLDAIIAAIEHGEEIEDGKLAMYRRAVAVLGDALKLYQEIRQSEQHKA